MNAALFEQFGIYGGIGGIALGVFLWIGLHIIKKSGRNPEVLKLVVILAWSLGFAGLVTWGWASRQNIRVESTHGVAAGENIKDSDITIAPNEAAEKEENPKKETGISAKGGVAAGGDIKRSTITIGGPVGKQ